MSALDTGHWTLDTGHWTLDTVGRGLLLHTRRGRPGCCQKFCRRSRVAVRSLPYICNNVAHKIRMTGDL